MLRIQRRSRVLLLYYERNDFVSKFFKKISMAVIPLAIVLSAVVFDVSGNTAVSAEEVPHKHYVCGMAEGERCSDPNHDDHAMIEEWTPITQKNGNIKNMKDGGYYYLAEDISISDYSIEISKNTNVTLCLNGHTINKANDSSVYYSHFSIKKGGTFTLCDCQEKENKENGKYKGLTNAKKSAVKVNGTFNMYGGIITDNQYRGLTNNGAGNASGGGVYVGDSGIFNMYGGEIVYNQAKASYNYQKNSASGGGVYVDASGSFTMYGGTISRNSASAYTIAQGGGVYISEGAFFKMYGGEILENSAFSSGDSSPDAYGGGIYVSEGATLNITNTNIKHNDIYALYGTYGGGVYFEGTKFTVSNSSISGNYVYGAGDYADIAGAGVFFKGESFELLDNSRISENEIVLLDAPTKERTVSGGGVFLRQGTLKMSDSEISDNKINPYSAKAYGAGVYIVKDVKSLKDVASFEMSNSKILNNSFIKSSKNYGSGIYVAGPLIVGDNSEILHEGEDNEVIYLNQDSKVSLEGHDVTITSIYANLDSNSSNYYNCLKIGSEFSVAEGQQIIIDNSKPTPKTCGDALKWLATIADDPLTEDRANVILSYFKLPEGTDEQYSITCDYSQKHLQILIPHTWVDDWTVDKEPTTSETGTAIKTCIVCNGKHTVTIPALSGKDGNEDWEVEKTTIDHEDYIEDIYTYKPKNKDYEGIEITVREITESGTHNHCMCGKDNCDEHSSERWTLITKAEDFSKMESGGYFYLGNDIVLSETIVIKEDVNLCLNGHKITNENGTVFQIQGKTMTGSSTTFNLCDCSSYKNVENVEIGSLSAKGGSAVLLSTKSMYTYLYFNMYGGKISDSTTTGDGGVNVSKGSFLYFNMYGGEISGNEAGGNGGGVYVGATGKFNKMSGGSKISGNKAGGNGGVYFEINKDTEFTMENSSICENKATTGGGLYVVGKEKDKTVKFTLTGGEISENTADANGGGVCVVSDNYCIIEFDMSGSKISGNQAVSNINDNGNGGGVYVYCNGSGSATFKMLDGEISENTAKSTSANIGTGSGGGVCVNTKASQKAEFIMSGGEISGNYAKKQRRRCFFIQRR